MRLSKFKVIGAFFLAATLSAPVRASDTSPEQAVPGTLNYVEGAVTVGTKAVDSKSIGSAEVMAGQSLTTGTGKAEILLTPGVFLRVGDNSSVKMVSSSLTDTEVGLDRGHAIIEVAEIHPENDIRIAAGGETTELLKTGLYDFDQQQLRVFEGKARVEYADRHIDVKGGREVSLGGAGQVKPEKFEKKSYYAGDLYRWSSLRSAYVAESNVNAAGFYANSGWGPWGPGWWGAGWYWDPWFDDFTFIPGDGIFYSPFGWGFYSPWCVYQAPFYGGYGYGHGRVHHHFSADYHNWGPGSHYVGSPRYVGGVYRGPGSSGGFLSGPHSGPRFERLTRIRRRRFPRRRTGFHGGGGFHGR